MMRKLSTRGRGTATLTSEPSAAAAPPAPTVQHPRLPQLITDSPAVDETISPVGVVIRPPSSPVPPHMSPPRPARRCLITGRLSPESQPCQRSPCRHPHWRCLVSRCRPRLVGIAESQTFVVRRIPGVQLRSQHRHQRHGSPQLRTQQGKRHGPARERGQFWL